MPDIIGRSARTGRQYQIRYNGPGALTDREIQRAVDKAEADNEGYDIERIVVQPAGASGDQPVLTLAKERPVGTVAAGLGARLEGEMRVRTGRLAARLGTVEPVQQMRPVSDSPLLRLLANVKTGIYDSSQRLADGMTLKNAAPERAKNAAQFLAQTLPESTMRALAGIATSPITAPGALLQNVMNAGTRRAYGQEQASNRDPLTRMAGAGEQRAAGKDLVFGTLGAAVPFSGEIRAATDGGVGSAWDALKERALSDPISLGIDAVPVVGALRGGVGATKAASLARSALRKPLPVSTVPIQVHSPNHGASPRTATVATEAPRPYAHVKRGSERARLAPEDLEQFPGGTGPMAFTFGDATNNGMYVNPTTGAQVRLHGGIGYSLDDEHFGRFAWASKGARQANAIPRRAQETGGLVHVVNMKPEAMLTSQHGVLVLQAEIDAAIRNGTATPSDFLHMVNAVIEMKGGKPIQLLGRRPEQALATLADHLTVLSFEQRKRIVQAALSKKQKWLPDYETVLPLMRDPALEGARAGDIVGSLYVDPKGQPVPARVLGAPEHPAYPLAIPGTGLGLASTRPHLQELLTDLFEQVRNDISQRWAAQGKKGKNGVPAIPSDAEVYNEVSLLLERKHDNVWTGNRDAAATQLTQPRPGGVLRGTVGGSDAPGTAAYGSLANDQALSGGGRDSIRGRAEPAGGGELAAGGESRAPNLARAPNLVRGPHPPTRHNLPSIEERFGNLIGGPQARSALHHSDSGRSGTAPSSLPLGGMTRAAQHALAERLGYELDSDGNIPRTHAQTIERALARRDELSALIDEREPGRDVPGSNEEMVIVDLRQQEAEQRYTALAHDAPETERLAALAEISGLGRLKVAWGREAGRNLGFIRAVVPDPTSVAHTITAVEKAVGEDLSPASRQWFAKKATEAKEAKEKIDAQIATRGEKAAAKLRGQFARFDTSAESMQTQIKALQKQARKSNRLRGRLASKTEAAQTAAQEAADAAATAQGEYDATLVPKATQRTQAAAEQRLLRANEVAAQRQAAIKGLEEELRNLETKRPYLDKQIAALKAEIPVARRENRMAERSAERLQQRLDALTAQAYESTQRKERLVSDLASKRAAMRKQAAADERIATLGADRARRTPHLNPYIDVALGEYTAGATKLDLLARRLKAKIGTDLPIDLVEELFKEAAARYKVDYKAVDDIAFEMSQRVERELRQRKSFVLRGFAALGDIANAHQTMLASGDLSGLGRQGGLVSGPNMLGLRGRTGLQSMFGGAGSSGAIRDMLRAGGSENELARQEAGLSARQTRLYGDANHYERVGLDLTTTDRKAGAAFHEEEFRSSPAERIPVLGRGVAASERAYNAVLNRLRADQFDYMVRGLKSTGEQLTRDQEVMARWTNVLTGRGDLREFGKPENAAVVASALANSVTWSPRFALSRAQFIVAPLNPMSAMYARGISRQARLRIAGDLAKTWASIYTTMLLARQVGCQVELDPRHQDFGLIQLPGSDLEIDAMAGLRPTMRASSRMLTNTTLDSRNGMTNKQPKPHDTDYPLELGKFLFGKSRPVIGLGTETLSGHTTTGEKFDAPEAATQLLLNIGVADMVRGFRAQGYSQQTAAELAAAFTLSTLGVGASVRDRFGEEADRHFDRKIQRLLPDEPAGLWNVISNGFARGER
jgi:hypothetical protein